MKRIKSKDKGITLIALVITIVVLIILAGVAISLTLGNNGIFNKAKYGKEQYNIAEAKEVIELKIAELQAEKEGKATLEELVEYLNEDDSIEYTVSLTKITASLTSDITVGDATEIYIVYNKYQFKVKKNMNVEYISKLDTNTNETEKITKFILLNGNTYIDTGLEESTIMEKSEFTIATRVYIDQNTQKTINHMGILGNHTATVGIMWQFFEKTSTLQFGIINQGNNCIKVDYTPYYNKWTDIVMVYKNGKVDMYMDGNKIGSSETTQLTPLGKIYIGKPYESNDRCMMGGIQSVKIWNKGLNESEVSNLNMQDKETRISPENILKEYDGSTQMSFVGDKYTIEPISKKISKGMLKFTGTSYVDIGLNEDKIMEKSEFTIAARVNIEEDEQKTINHMGILGNHTATTGIMWQFFEKTSTLQFGIINQGNDCIRVDYTAYYGKWTDIVMTYKNGIVEVYFNGNKVGSSQTTQFTPLGKIYIGKPYESNNRDIKGKIESVKIWNKGLEENEITNLNMQNETSIQKDSLLKEIELTTLEEIQKNGSFIGTEYQMVLEAE